MNILLIGDGPLARAVGERVADGGHALTTLFVDEEETERLDGLIEEQVELVIEAVVAEPTEKWDIVTELDRLLPADTPLLSAALNASATEAASWCQHPGRLVGWAALPPLEGATVIELLPALQSEQAAVERAKAFWQSIGLEPVAITDSVGGVLPRMLCNLINEAAFALMERVASPADIDAAMQLGTNYPRGPLAWADAIGLDQVVGILEALGNEFGPDQYRPAPLLRQYARAGRTFH